MVGDDAFEPESSGDRLLPGQIVFQKFKVMRRIGGGGMADVYEVLYTNLDKHLA